MSAVDELLEINSGAMFNSVTELEELKKQEASWIIRLLNIKENHTVLDYGAGFGFITKHISPMAKHIYTYDIKKKYIDICADTCKEVNNVTHCGPNTDKLEQLTDIDIIIIKDVIPLINFDKINSLFKLFDKITKKDNAQILFNYFTENSTDYTHNNDFFQHILYDNNFKQILLKKEHNLVNKPEIVLAKRRK